MEIIMPFLMVVAELTVAVCAIIFVARRRS